MTRIDMQIEAQAPFSMSSPQSPLHLPQIQGTPKAGQRQKGMFSTRAVSNKPENTGSGSLISFSKDVKKKQ